MRLIAPKARLAKVSPHIWQVRLTFFTQVHVWLVAHPSGLTLVDSGFAAMAPGVLDAIEATKTGPLEKILLTHGHPDHAGGAALIARQLHVPVYAHRLELPFLEGDQYYPRISRLLQPRQRGIVAALPEAADGTLEPLDGLKPWFAPGHTPGHVVYHHEEDDVLLAGDLFKARKGELKQLGHLYSLDREEATRSEAILHRLRPSKVEASHGGTAVQPLKSK